MKELFNDKYLIIVILGVLACASMAFDVTFKETVVTAIVGGLLTFLKRD